MNELLLKVESFVLKEFLKKKWRDFAYHNVNHTQNVVRESKELAILSGLAKKETIILQIAAWFHDLGYLKGKVGHEEQSIKIAKKFLKKQKASSELVLEVENIIKATNIEFERFQFLSQKIIRDADLSGPGLKKFNISSENLRMELAQKSSMTFNDTEWYIFQIQYLSKLTYLTEAAKGKYGKRKEKNIKKYKKRLKLSQA